MNILHAIYSIAIQAILNKNYYLMIEFKYNVYDIYISLASDPCEPNPCHYGGTCEEIPFTFKCTCRDGYTGQTCETHE